MRTLIFFSELDRAKQQTPIPMRDRTGRTNPFPRTATSGLYAIVSECYTSRSIVAAKYLETTMYQVVSNPHEANEVLKKLQKTLNDKKMAKFRRPSQQSQNENSQPQTSDALQMSTNSTMQKQYKYADSLKNITYTFSSSLKQTKNSIALYQEKVSLSW